MLCDLCEEWIHIRCNFLNLNDYNNLKNDPDPFFCIPCLKKNIPYSNLTNNEFILLNTKGVYAPNTDVINAFTHSTEMQDHIDGLNEYLNKLFTSPDDEDDDNICPLNCNYYSPEEFFKAKFNSSKSFSIFHYNVHSIQLHIDSLRTLLHSIESENFEFDILAISESKLLKNISPTIDINIPDNYHSPISTPTEACKGGTLL